MIIRSIKIQRGQGGFRLSLREPLMENPRTSRKVHNREEVAVTGKIDAVVFYHMRDIAGRVTESEPTEDFGAGHRWRGRLCAANHGRCKPQAGPKNDLALHGEYSPTQYAPLVLQRPSTIGHRAAQTGARYKTLEHDGFPRDTFPLSKAKRFACGNETSVL